MCFSFPVSLSFGVLGLALAAWSETKKRRAYRDIALFYSLMEFLQASQYLLADKCYGLNMFSTYVAHVLVVVQPALWNLFRYRTQRKHRKVFLFAFYLSLIWAAFFTLRLFYLPFGPVVPNLDKREIMVGERICSRMGPTHIYWTLPYYSYSGLEPNLFTYLLLWFVPTLYEKQGVLKLILWIMQIVLVQACVSLADELPTFWCALSVPFLCSSIFSKRPSPSLL